jgi:CRISPR/Cas system-associated exonuclease Cas4 (RecB family)
VQISVSRLRAYLQCPQKFRFRYLDEAEPEFLSVHLLFGQALHYAIAAYHRSKNAIGGQGMQTEFARYWHAQKQLCQQQNQPIRGIEAEGELFDKAYALCDAYAAEFRQLVPTTTQDVELLFDVPLIEPQSGYGTPNHSLTGKIDLIADASVYEFKTASRTASQGEADASIQLTAYALAHLYIYDCPPKRLYLVSLVKTKTPKIEVLKTTRCETEYRHLIEMATQIARAIQAQVFFKNRETLYGCQTCEYYNRCLSHSQRAEPDSKFNF